MRRKKHASVYHGRYKGSTDVHCPNDTFREEYDKSNLPSIQRYICSECGRQVRIHRLEYKAYVCPCQKEIES